MKKLIMSSLLLSLTLALAACSNSDTTSMPASHNMDNMNQTRQYEGYES